MGGACSMRGSCLCGCHITQLGWSGLPGRRCPCMPTHTAEMRHICLSRCYMTWLGHTCLSRWHSVIRNAWYSWHRLNLGLYTTKLGSLWWRCERSEEHTSELQSLAYLVCRLLLEKKKKTE